MRTKKTVCRRPEPDQRRHIPFGVTIQRPQPDSPDPQPLLSLRATVILVLALLVAAAATALTYHGTRQPAAAALAGGAAFAAAVPWFNKLIE